MGTSMVSFATQHRGPSRWRRLRLALVLGALAWIVANPQAFVDLWLTSDQQGRLWFQFGYYERASRTFEDPRWRGFSLYAGEDFATAERYFSQYQDAGSLLARANALAHQRDYVSAKRAYEELASRYPDHPAPAVNIPIVEALIEATQKMSDGQANETGKPGRKPGEGSESSDGDERQRTMELEQYSADQLLQDPGLTEMWLRQIQRDPSEFLATKFYLQLEQNEGDAP
jgi:Ca-activated chloride channel family protein